METMAVGAVWGREDQLLFFEEKVELLGLIQRLLSLPSTAADCGSSDFASYNEEEMCLQSIQRICTKYNEQPELLDPHLDSILNPLMLVLQHEAQSTAPDMAMLGRACQVLNFVVSVRGRKAVSRFFPHATHDFEPALFLLERTCRMLLASEEHEKPSSMGSVNKFNLWISCSTLLLWLSVLVLIPFNFATIDSSLDSPAPGQSHDAASETAPSDPTPAQGSEATALASPVMCRTDMAHFDLVSTPPMIRLLLGLCLGILKSRGLKREFAALLLSRLLTRPDSSNLFEGFISWSLDSMKQQLQQGDVFSASLPPADILVHGILSTLAAIFKAGGRHASSAQHDAIWRGIIVAVRSMPSCSGDISVRLQTAKVVQRLALSQLPAAAASWRYQHGHKRLKFGEEAASGEGERYAMPSSAAGAEEEGEGEEEGGIEVPDLLEEIIEELLAALRDPATSVRWSAAKGVSRVAARLPKEMADEVVGAVMAMMSANENECAWHGACLALAELAMRGVLLPSRLPQVLPLIEQALHYDIPRAAFSVGDFVRDAAAFICWAFARCYSADVMRLPFRELAPHLLRVACFDREVHCRRAAAAAFQENVGRQGGSFPHGIQIVSAADFVSLGPRKAAYRDVAVSVAAFEEFRLPLVEELQSSKSKHWSPEIRQLSAESLALLAPLDPPFFSLHLLPSLLPLISSPELAVRHGALLAVAHLLPAVREAGGSITADTQQLIASIINYLKTSSSLIFRGKGGDMLRCASSDFIAAVARSSLPLQSNLQDDALSLLEEHLRSESASVQQAAASSFGLFCHHYFLPQLSQRPVAPSSPPAVLQRTTLRQVALLQKGSPVSEKRGAALALSHLPAALLAPCYRDVIDGLCAAAVDNRDKTGQTEVELRVNAVNGLRVVTERLGIISEDADYSRHLSQGDEIARQECGIPWVVVESDVIGALFNAMSDYSADKRGDVGRWVREAAMEALVSCGLLLWGAKARDTERVASDGETEGGGGEGEGKEGKGGGGEGNWRDDEGHGSLQDGSNGTCKGMEVKQMKGMMRVLRQRALVDFSVLLIGQLGKQAVEKIDHTRQVAGQCLLRFLFANLEDGAAVVDKLPCHKLMRRVMPDSDDFDWKAESQTFSRLVDLISYPPFLHPVLSGLCLSVGSLGGAAAAAASSSLLSVLKSEHDGGVPSEEAVLDASSSSAAFNADLVESVADTLLRLLKERRGQDLFVVPVIKTMTSLLSAQVFDCINDKPRFSSFSFDVALQIQTELWDPISRDVPKIISSIDLLCHLFSWGGEGQKVCTQLLLSLLTRAIEKVRIYSAEQLYLCLISSEDDGSEGEACDLKMEAEEILSESNWQTPVKDMAATRAKLHSCLGVTPLVRALNVSNGKAS